MSGVTDWRIRQRVKIRGGYNSVKGDKLSPRHKWNIAEIAFPPQQNLHLSWHTRSHHIRAYTQQYEQTKGWSWRRSGGRGYCCPLTSLKVISLDGTNTGWKQRQQWICWWYKRDHHVLVTSPTISLPTWRPPTLSDSLTLPPPPPHHPRGSFRCDYYR